MKSFKLFICIASVLMIANITVAQEVQKEPVKRDVTRLSEDYYIPGRFKGKTIVVTGGARGIGKSTATRAVKEGANVVVMVASIAGMTGLAGNPAYVASKHAVNGLMRNAAIDYVPYGIRVNSVNMAETQTPMVARAGEFVAAEIKAGMGFGMGRIKTMSLLKYCDSQHRGSFAWEQASNILYLISDEASAVTGTVMATDGGWTDF